MDLSLSMMRPASPNAPVEVMDVDKDVVVCDNNPTLLDLVPIFRSLISDLKFSAQM
jgi:hypothetical protein